MGHVNKKSWGKSIMYYCPKSNNVWQYSRLGKVYKFPDMPTYGLERKELPQDDIVA